MEGLVLSGYGQGESFGCKKNMISTLRKAISSIRAPEEAASCPIMVQGLNDIEQVLAAET